MTLPDKIEQASEGSRELDAEIAAAVRYFPKDVGFVWKSDLKPNSPEVGRVECCTSLGTGGPHYAAPRYTTSIDDALKLVPEGWRAGFEMGGKFDMDRGEQQEAWCWPFDSDFDPDWQSGQQGYRDAQDATRATAKTPALAICAAALRAQERERDG